MITDTTQSPAQSQPQSGGTPHGSTQTASTAVVGLQWGDEGKGKVIDLLAPRFDAVVRYNGGANAGHTVVIGGKKHAFHLMPSGVLHQGVRSVIANGVVVDPTVILSEIERASQALGGEVDLLISDRAHVVMPYHKAEDEMREQILSAHTDKDRSIGTTKRGIGPAYSDKAHRSTAVRVGDLLRPDLLKEKLERICEAKRPVLSALGADPAVCDASALHEECTEAGKKLRSRICDTGTLLNEMISAGGRLLFEGANATLLDLDHGTFPYVTSSNCSVCGIPSGTGLAPRHVGRVQGVLKAYSTRVGAGPFPTERDDEIGDRIRTRGNEFGTTTGRPRRCGWLDLVALKYAVTLNGVDSLAVMLLDVLAGFDELSVCTGYRTSDGSVTDRFPADASALEAVTPVYETVPGFQEEITGVRTWDDLPEGARRYLELIEQRLGVPVGIVSVGPDREQTIVRSID